MTNTGQKERTKWWALKGALIARYGTLSAAAKALKCSPTALRLSAAGMCPEVAAKIDRALAQP